MVTFDEDDFTASNQIPTLFAGPMVRPGAYPEAVNHYRLLRTLEAHVRAAGTRPRRQQHADR